MQHLRSLSPKSLAAPLARYCPAIEVPAGARLVFISGQLGIDAKGETPESAEAQAELCFQAIRALLAEAKMGLSDIVRLNAFVSREDYLADYMRVRDRHVGDPPPASTLMIVSGFSRPQFKVEVECVAAKVG
ncbi:MAG: RidA family protein [Hyphomicrobiales bacterium]|nr:RidA family protein [Hyphomicrobiales bacterium]